MKKSGINVFVVALLISAGIHVAAYCSMNVYTGLRTRYHQSIAVGTDAHLFEIGLIEVPEPSVQKQFSSSQPEKSEIMEIMEDDSEILLDRLSQEIESDYPEESGEVSRLTTGLSRDEYRAGVHRRIAEAIFYPRRARLSHLEGVVKVSFLIGIEGCLEDFKVVDPSPYEIFNRAARTIMEKAAPFPPPGPDLIGRTITVPIKFESMY